MKKTILTMIVAACASLFALTSCEKAPEDLIVGTWNLTTANMEMGGISIDVDPTEMGGSSQFVFKADGTCTLRASEDGEEEILSGSYVVTDGEPSSILNIIIDGESQTFIIQQLDKETLVLKISESEDGVTVQMTMTFKRA